MISRKTSMTIANAYYKKFTRRENRNGRSEEKVLYNDFYDFLYVNDYEAWFCNLVKKEMYPRSMKEFLLKIHTGESFYSVAKDWSSDQRKKLGQEYLLYLAEDFIKWYKSNTGYYSDAYKSYFDDCIRSLELDGYVFRNDVLLKPENDITNVEEESNVIGFLYSKLGFYEKDMAMEFLKLSEEHYVNGRWSDCINNSRKFFEFVFYQVALKHSSINKIELNDKIMERPVEVRQYLENNKLIEKKEREAIDKIYGLLSHTGAHPYIAESDQARFLRQISLVFTQFIMLRLENNLA